MSTSRLWLLGTALIGILLQIYYYSQLPDRVATHFGAGGLPNDWMSKGANMAMAIGLILFLSLIFGLLPLLIKKVPPRFVNLPKREYWLSPENRENTLTRLASSMSVLGVATNVFILYVLHLAYRTNQSHPVKLNEGMFWPALGSFMTFAAVWSVLLVIRFNSPPMAADEKTLPH
ncbi:MAG: DUF1648 domain-containing protein [Dehalococcoidia bacterium]|nr:DUF1648 domain-containing protein [Dehalococcoidia bacterium]